MSELLVFSAPSRRDLAGRAAEVSGETAGSLTDLAVRLTRQTTRPAFPWRLAILAEDRDDLVAKLGKARELLAGDRPRFNVANRIFCGQAEEGGRKTAFLFPGFGAQYPNMLGRLYDASAAVRRWFDALDPEDAGRSRRNLLLFAEGEYGPEDKLRLTRESTLRRITDAVLLANLAHHSLLAELGLPCDAMAGHSYGEAALLVAAGMAADYRPVTQLLRRITQAPPDPAGRGALMGPSLLLAVTGASRAALEPRLADPGRQVFLALDNCPQQAILCGAAEEMEAVEAAIKARKELCFRLPRIELAVHTPLFPVAQGSLREIYGGLALGPPALPVYSCAIAAPFPPEPAAVRDLLADGWVSPVRFRETVERLYADGIRTFVEVGPGGHLAGFVRDTLRNTDAVAIPTDREEVDSALQIRLCLAQLFVLGHRLDLARLPAALGEPKPAAPVRPVWLEEKAPRGRRPPPRAPGAPGDSGASAPAGGGDPRPERRRDARSAARLLRAGARLAGLDRAGPEARAAAHRGLRPPHGRAPGRLPPRRERAAEPRPLQEKGDGPEPIAIVGMGCRFPGGRRPGGVLGAAAPRRRRGGRGAGRALGELGGPRPRAGGDGAPRRLPGGRRPLRRGVLRHLAARGAGASTRSSGCCWRSPGRRWSTPAIAPERLRGHRDRRLRRHQHQRLRPAAARRGSGSAVDGYLGTGTARSIAAGPDLVRPRPAGPGLAVDTACSSSLVARPPGLPEPARRRVRRWRWPAASTCCCRPRPAVVPRRARALSARRPLQDLRRRGRRLRARRGLRRGRAQAPGRRAGATATACWR